MSFHIAEREDEHYWKFSAFRRKYTGDYAKNHYASKREAKKHFKQWVTVQESDAPHEF